VIAGPYWHSKKSFALAMRIYPISKKFPQEERYGLTAPIINSSRSVCTNITEAYNRRRYKKLFISKLNDAENENAETQLWFDFALACNYITKELYRVLTAETMRWQC
jgi:four helix bundle protein